MENKNIKDIIVKTLKKRTVRVSHLAEEIQRIYYKKEDVEFFKDLIIESCDKDFYKKTKILIWNDKKVIAKGFVHNILMIGPILNVRENE